MSALEEEAHVLSLLADPPGYPGVVRELLGSPPTTFSDASSVAYSAREAVDLNPIMPEVYGSARATLSKRKPRTFRHAIHSERTGCTELDVELSAPELAQLDAARGARKEALRLARAALAALALETPTGCRLAIADRAVSWVEWVRGPAAFSVEDADDSPRVGAHILRR
jgi:hypothetical protein